jgi:hypothetical protein
MKLYQARFTRGWLARAEDFYLKLVKPGLKQRTLAQI